ncbi:hypothetical protein CK203_035877 [Vitis vinifera]|uniref:Secreted protein n=1 Tax=Vitis vinifera TaxID=29760 RepID=A0A438I050_VITVI|nr:hypothetical protein CK203_035877 [Vitis vinifera]
MGLMFCFLRWGFVFCLNFEVYPKVRVKEQDQDDRFAERDPTRSSCSPVTQQWFHSSFLEPGALKGKGIWLLK